MNGCRFLLDTCLCRFRSDFSHSICYCNKAILGLLIPRCTPHSSLLCSRLYRGWPLQAATQTSQHVAAILVQLTGNTIKRLEPWKIEQSEIFSFLCIRWLLLQWLCILHGFSHHQIDPSWLQILLNPTPRFQ